MFSVSSRILAIAVAILLISPPSQGRKTIVWNRDWSFELTPTGNKAKDTSYGGKQQVHLPHSFSMPYFMSPVFYTGMGIYRKSLTVPAAWQGKKLFLDFEGAFQDTTVYANGKQVGRHVGGYTGFRIDITPALRVGENEITVRVSNKWSSRIAPRAGEHTFSGGIYRDVYLVQTSPIFIPLHGVWVRPQNISATGAEIHVQTELMNELPTPTTLTIQHTITAPDESVVLQHSTQVSVPQGKLFTHTQNVGKITNPALWDTESPQLYQACTIIKNDKGEVMDQANTTFGIRTIAWTAENGFSINGKRTWLQGVNVHQDQAGWGDATTNASHYRDVLLMKEAGFNFIRGSHYPHDPAFVSACDKLGVMFMSEGIFWGMGGQKADNQYWNCDAYPRNPADVQAFTQSLAQQVSEMIRAARNNPSVIAWSISNEPFFTHTDDLPAARQLCTDMITLTKVLDPDRPACAGGAQRADLDRLGDIASYNGDGRQFPNPNRPNLVSEYGSHSCKRPGNYDASAKDFEGLQKDWRAGIAIWCGFDHGSIWAAGGRMGIIDYFRIPKRSWYWYRNLYRQISPPDWPTQGKPVALKITADKTTLTSIDGQDDAHILVEVVDATGKPLSNSLPVLLEITSGPGEFPTGKTILFSPGTDIDMIDGKCAITFRSYYSGITHIRATSPRLQGATLSITSQGCIPFSPQARETKSRPYRPFTEADKTTLAALQGTPIQVESKPNLAQNRPCSASSNAAHRAQANDGILNTAWSATAQDAAPQWTLNMEFDFPVESIRLEFPDARARAVTIQTSLDAEKWEPLPTQDCNAKSLRYKLPSPKQAQYIRIQFASAANAAIRELIVEPK